MIPVVVFAYCLEILTSAQMTNGALNRYVRSQLSPGADGVIEGAPAVGLIYSATDRVGPFEGRFKGPRGWRPDDRIGVSGYTNAKSNQALHKQELLRRRLLCGEIDIIGGFGRLPILKNQSSIKVY